MFYDIVYACSAILVLRLSYFIYQTMRRPRNSPPGPSSFPLIGNFHLLIPIYKKSSQFAEVYGNIFSVKMSSRNVVCVHGYELIQEIMNDRPHDFASRPYKNVINQLTRGKLGNGIILAPYGPKWAAHRKFFHTAFRTLGLNQNGIEKHISGEIPAITQELEKMSQKGKPFDPSFVFDYGSLNVLASFTFGDRYDYGDSKFQELLLYNQQYFKYAMAFQTPFFMFYSMIPYLYQYWLPRGANKVVEAVRKIKDFVSDEIKHHQNTLDPLHPRDFIDCYLIEMKDNQWFEMEGLEITILDLFQAGTETTDTTLRWAFLYMANHPDIQRKVQKEIDDVIGLQREPRYEDKKLMPYCDATILEVQRHATFLPFGVARTTYKDTTIRGYTIAKDTMVIPDFYGLHHSPDHWRNPNEFDPRNFLEDDGSVGKRKAFFPFGGGVRICSGKQVAKQELFLFFVGILQKFTVSKPVGVEHISEVPKSGFTLTPEPYKLQFTPRF